MNEETSKICNRMVFNSFSILKLQFKISLFPKNVQQKKRVRIDWVLCFEEEGEKKNNNNNWTKIGNDINSFHCKSGFRNEKQKEEGTKKKIYAKIQQRIRKKRNPEPPFVIRMDMRA